MGGGGWKTPSYRHQLWRIKFHFFEYVGWGLKKLP